VGDLRIKAFKKHHDAADPFSFTVSGHGLTVGVFTDIGHACEEVISHFKECHAAFLETNYDAEMLDNGHYPPHLKRRIKSDKGHLSNNQALELFKQHRHAQLSHLFLSHLSAENNSPALVDQLFRQHAGNTNIIVASRHYESSVYNITGRLGEEERLQMPENVRMSSMKDNAAPVNLSAQLSLF
jgi:phosphoribosyl 1,2-cyclic phosphodiesterase